MPRSFRFDKKQLEALQSEARRQRESLSSLLNRLIAAYIEYGRFAKQAHALSLSRNTFSLLLNAIGDEELKYAAEKAGKSASGFVAAVEGDLTISSVRRFATLLSAHADMFEFNEPKDTEAYWVLLHELGPKWSLFLAHYFGAIFAEAKIRVRTEASDRTVTFWLEHS